MVLNNLREVPTVGDNLRKIVVHMPGKGRIVPCDEVEKMDLVGTLKAFLRNSQIVNPSLVQSIMWPCVARLQSVVGVSGPCHGKTLGWLIPLLNSLANRAQYRQLNQHHAPLAIVLCPGLKCASIVFKLIQDISSKARLGLKVLLASAGAKHTEPSDYIGLDVLVTAPAWLIQLIGQRYTSMNRCCHLVVEEGDRTLYMWQKEVDEIMVSWHKHDSSLPYQLIIVAERWNHYVEQFTRTFMVEGSSPVVVLGNLMEAVIYGKVDMVPEFTTNVTDKISRVVKLMKARDKTKRMVICCKDFNMGVMVSKFCEEVTVLHSGLDKSKTKLIFDMWCQAPVTPLVVSDITLQSLAIDGADRGTVLIHWDLPTDSMTTFSARFAFIKNGVRSIFSPSPAQPVRVFIMLGPENAASFNFIIPFLKRSGANISDNLNLFYKSVSLTKAKQLMVTGSPLCSVMVTTATCTDKTDGRCMARHFLHTELDYPKTKFDGVIKFTVLKVETPVVYWVRIQDMKMAKMYQKLVLGMARHFAKAESWKQLKVLERGRLVVLACSDGLYRRARLEQIVFKVRGQKQYMDKVEVFGVDCGEKMMVKPSDIGILPDSLGIRMFPIAAIKVVVGGLAAMDGDWGLETSKYVSSMMKGQDDREVVCRGKVLLNMSDTVWLEKCQVMEWQQRLGEFVCKFETATWLLKEGHATTNEKYMQLLYKMADIAGIPRPQVALSNENNNIVIPPMIIQQSQLPPPDAPFQLQSTTHPDILSILNWQNNQLAKLQDTVSKLLSTPAQRLSEQAIVKSSSKDGHQCEEQSMMSSLDGTEDDHTYTEASSKQVGEDVEEKKENLGMGWNGVSSELEEGLTFESRSEVKKFMTHYGRSKYSSLVITAGGASDGCTSKQITFSCAYGHGRTSVATEEGRPIQHSKKKDCPVFVRVSCHKRGDTRDFCVVKAFEEEHNHINTEAMFHQDTNKIEEEDELEFVEQSLKLNVKATQLRRRLQLKYNKPGISSSHVRYTMKKTKGPDHDDEELDVFLLKIEEEGGKIEILEDVNKKVRGLTIQTIKMAKAYSGAKPTVVLFDTTFGFSREGYKMSAFCYTNPVSNKGEIAMLIFLADEGAEALEFAFKSFKKATVQDPSCFMIDKDFTELLTIAKIFPNSTPLLCQFHVLKYLKTLVSTARAAGADIGVKVDIEKKSVIMDGIRSLLYASTKEDAQAKSAQLQQEMMGVEVRVGNGDKSYYTNLREYFLKNWEACGDKWMTCERRNIPGLDDENTNNKLERLWRSMKDYLKLMTSGSSSIANAVGILVNYAERGLVDSYTWDLRHEMRIAHKDPKIVEEYKNAAKELNDRGMRKLKLSVDLMLKRETLMEVVEGEGETSVREKFSKKKVATKVDDCTSSVHSEEAKDDVATGHDGFVKKKVDKEDKEIYPEEFDSKTYQAGENRCNCSWSVRSGAPCRHVLLIRRSKNLPLFHPSLFNQRFWKERNLDLLKEFVINEEVTDYNKYQCVDDPEDVKIKVLNKGDKYRMLCPLAERLLEATTRCGSKKVEVYQDEMQAMINNAKEGKSLFERESSCAQDKQETQVKDEFYNLEKDDKHDASVSDAKNNKFGLLWHSKSKLGKVGRPRDSKVKFIMKKKDQKAKKRKVEPVETLSIKKSRTDSVVCRYPFDINKPGQWAVYQSDLACLRPRFFITNDIVDFRLRFLQPNGPAGQKVWLLSNSHAQQLHSWRSCPTLRQQVEAARCYQEGGCQIIVMAWCESSHYFGVVGVCGDQPLIYVLESIGGYGEPEGAGILANFMKEMRTLAEMPPSDVPILTPDVPLQPQASNDCAIFMLESASKILEAPEMFSDRAQLNQLGNWYPASSVTNRRYEISKLVEKLAQEQNPDEQSISQVEFDLPRKKNVDIEKLRKPRRCGICRDVGHSRKKCPMKENISPLI